MIHTGVKVGILATGVVASGLCYKFMLTPPKNVSEKLTRMGYELLKQEADGKVMLEENMTELKQELKQELNDNNKDPEGDKLKTFCEDLYKKTPDNESINKATKYCTYSPKTIKGLLIKKGGNKLLNSDADEEKGKTIFNIQKYYGEFNTTLKNGSDTETTLSGATDKDTGTPILKEGCKTIIKKEGRTNKNDVYNAQKYCSDPGVTTIEELIKLKDPRGKLSNNGEKNVKIGKDTTEVQQQVQSTPIGKENLKKGCEEHIKDKLDTIDGFYKIFAVVRDGCKSL